LQECHVVAATALAVATGDLAGAIGDPLELGNRVDAAVEDLESIRTDAHIDELADVRLWYRVEVGLVEDVRRRVDVALDDVARVVRHAWQRLEIGPLLVEHLGECSPGHRMGAPHRVRVAPPAKALAKRLAARKRPPVAEVLVDVSKRPLDFSFVRRISPRRHVYCKAVVCGEIDEADIQNRLIALPAVDDARHGVSDALVRYTFELSEAVV
jgi:hypothetical protein